MADQTNIEWCDSTFNPFIGCTKVSPGCDNCYAENLMDHRMHKVQWGPHGTRVRTSAANWRKPLAWNAAHDKFFAQHGRRQRVFCASLADVFDNAVPDEWRADLFELIEKTPNLDWLLLTKRIGNVGNMLPVPFDFDRLYPNVWLGISVVNQAEADRDIPKLLALEVRVRFLSMEPLLGPVDLSRIDLDGHREIYPLACTLDREDDDGNELPDLPGLDWIIVGGESGQQARPMHPDWPRQLRDQCAAAGVPFLFKQWGEWLPGAHYTAELARIDADPYQSRYECALWNGEAWDIGRFSSDEIHFSAEPMYRVGKKAAGRELYGAQHDGFPELA